MKRSLNFRGRPGKNLTVGRLDDLVRRYLPTVENDCEDQGFSNISDGCNKWPCKNQPLKRENGHWRCTNCGGYY